MNKSTTLGQVTQPPPPCTRRSPIKIRAAAHGAYSVATKEINEEHHKILKEIFGEKSNILQKDFLTHNEKFDVIIGMYHDQVLAPIKSIFGFKAINITLGLPFIRISPDHGPNERMMGKNLSNPLSLIQAIRFLDKN